MYQEGIMTDKLHGPTVEEEMRRMREHPSCRSCGEELFMDISKRLGYCDDCRGELGIEQ
jgi:ribosomal protein L37AE/L43A